VYLFQETHLEHVLCVPLSSAGHLLIRSNNIASICALVERCKIRSLLSRAWAHPQDLVMQVMLIVMICSEPNNGTGL